MTAPSRWPGPLALVLAIALTAAGVAACGAGRGILGTNTSPCFLALPTAKRAVEGHGSLAGLRLIDIPRLTAPGDRAIRNLLAQLPSPHPREVCLIAYSGTFAPGQVEQPIGPPPPATTGRYAIAVVTTPGSGLLGTFIVQHEPVNFRRSHLGI
jgi:hypothetical protein